MQVDDRMYGNPERNLWAAVIGNAKDDLPRSENLKWSSGREREAARNSAIRFFNLSTRSRLSAICFQLGLDLGATIEMARKLCPDKIKKP